VAEKFKQGRLCSILCSDNDSCVRVSHFVTREIHFHGKGIGKTVVCEALFMHARYAKQRGLKKICIAGMVRADKPHK